MMRLKGVQVSKEEDMKQNTTSDSRWMCEILERQMRKAIGKEAKDSSRHHASRLPQSREIM